MKRHSNDRVSLAKATRKVHLFEHFHRKLRLNKSVAEIPRSRRSLDVAKIVGNVPCSLARPKNTETGVSSVDSKEESVSVEQDSRISDEEDEDYSFGIDDSTPSPLRQVTPKYVEHKKWLTPVANPTPLCGRILAAYAKMQPPEMRRIGNEVEFIAISISTELDWTIVKTQITDLMIRFCTQQIQPGQKLVLTVAEPSLAQTGRNQVVLTSEYPLKIQPVKNNHVHNKFNTANSDFILTVQRVSTDLTGNNRRFLITDNHGQHGVMTVPTDHPDFSRLLTFAPGQKMIVRGVKIEKVSSITTLLDSLIPLSSTQRTFYDLSFGLNSKVELPLDEFERSLLNQLPCRTSLPNGRSEHFNDYESVLLRRHSRVTLRLSKLVQVKSDEYFCLGESGTALRVISKRMIKDSVTVNCVYVGPNGLEVDEWTQLTEDHFRPVLMPRPLTPSTPLHQIISLTGVVVTQRTGNKCIESNGLIVELYSQKITQNGTITITAILIAKTDKYIVLPI